jgi:abortive infection bacteriophage resistance protein
MTLAPYTKPHATAAQRVAHLRSRGLIVKRPNVAARKIDLVGYERLRIYFLSRRQFGVVNRPFHPGTTYQQILRLYDCDSLLRDACFAAVGQFELLLRNAMSEALSDGFGSHPYFDLAAFKDAGANLEALQSFMTAYSQSKDQRAAHYRQTYATPILPPIWTMKEFLTFGRSVRIFKCLEGSVRTHIATVWGAERSGVHQLARVSRRRAQHLRAPRPAVQSQLPETAPEPQACSCPDRAAKQAEGNSRMPRPSSDPARRAGGDRR